MRRLKLTERRLRGTLSAAASGLNSVGGRPFDVGFDDGYYLGNGATDNFSDSVSHITVYTRGLFDFDIRLFPYIDDLKFTKALVTMCHEYGHYLQNYGPSKDIDLAISEASVIKNDKYYSDNWKRMPHEIAAEAVGVKLAWDMMDQMFPDFADTCMLEYINDRAEHSSYMLPAANNGYGSRDEVLDAFDAVMDRSLEEPRPVSGGFSAYKDESVQLLVQDQRNWKLSPNAFHFDRVTDPVSGRDKDRMMASLVLVVHPELLDERPILQTTDLSVEHVFGKPLCVCTLPCKEQPSPNLSRMRAMMPGDDKNERYGTIDVHGP